ncbi:MAG: hypothetical protein V4582_16465 [Pseudomonadota bacterium]
MRRLKEAGAPSVRLLELRKIDACGAHLLRADLQIDGSSGNLRYVPKIPERFDITIKANGQPISCTVRLH